jgi:hypothetical protein
MVRAAKAMSRHVNLVDLSSSFGDVKKCYAVIGGASVYYDFDHMTMEFSATLASGPLTNLSRT